MEKIKQLKKLLLDIRCNNWEIPNEVNKYEFALTLMDNIGTIDSELRDDLILVMLWNMITEKKLSKDEIKGILKIALSDKHLFYGLGKKDDDSVFNRSFSVLIIRWIIFYHNNFGENLLSEEEMMEVYQDLIRYVRLEQDFRGYIEVKGWGHTMGHSGDALRTLALCNYIKHDELLEILEVVKEKISIIDYVYINEEAERLVSVVVNIMSRKILTNEEIVFWIKSFEDFNKPKDFPNMHYFKENVKNFLRSLYFRLKFKNNQTLIFNEIEEVLNHQNESFNKIIQ